MVIRMKWIAFFLLFCTTVFSWDFQDKIVEGYVFEWDREEDFQEAAELFVDSFLFAYQDYTPQQLGVKDIEIFLSDVIADELSLKEEDPDAIHWLIAKQKGEVVGLLILELTKYPEVYGRQLAITPSHMRRGVGTEFVNILLENLPETSRLVAITRVVNQTSSHFIESLGFTRVDYMHEGYDLNKYVGFEYIP
ncbi:MAG: hypothetical protein K1060chlam2_00417 [Chlamydiae bacterium]|nr:hypothetical protein [Chlamydiota bacterium]